MKTRVLVVFVVLLGTAVAVARADRLERVPARTSFSEFPMHFGDWKGVQEPPFTKQVLDVLRPDDYLTRSYFTTDGAVVGLYIGYWQTQRQGETIHSPLNCLPGSGWQPVSRSTIPLDGTDGDQTANRYLIQKGLDRQVVFYWYQSHGRMVASEYWSKWYLITDAVRLNRTDGGIVRVSAPIRGEDAAAVDRADQSARRFVKALVPQLDGFLPR